jgi:glycosyltransferase involved in cell wall biosynthesis
MLVGVCDFPGDYLFPPIGYGGIERWLWAVAVGARRAGADVHLLGPQWRQELADDWTVRPIRLEDLTPDGPQIRSLRATGYDLLVVGHEYPSLPAWRTAWARLCTDVATFQHWPYFRHRADAFDGQRSRLYTYSEEMRKRYAAHHPIPELAVHADLHEPDFPAHDGDDLVWLGRIDAEKSPHLAIRAAQLLGRNITVAGPVFDTAYMETHRVLFTADHVTLAGEIGGERKMRLLAEANVLVYTCAHNYVEAGAATFGESLRLGTPVAALAWWPGTCAHAALCADSGSMALADPNTTDALAAKSLADAIERATPLRARNVREIGLYRFDPVRHFQTLAARPC